MSVELPPPPTPPELSTEPQAATVPAGIPREIDLGAIVPNPHQPRRQMNDLALLELAASIKSTGIIQPVVVRQVGEQFQLIAGERRYRAATLAGLSTIPAIIRDVDSFTQAQMALIENVQREDLNAIDRAAAYKSLMKQLGLTQQELAIRIGEDRSSIANFLRLLDLSPAVQEMVRDKLLSVGHAKLLGGITDLVEQERLARVCLSQDLSVRNLERMLASTAEPPADPSEPPRPSAHLVDLEKSIARQIGMRVQVRSGTKGKGKLVIHYASLDQFDDLVKRLGVTIE